MQTLNDIITSIHSNSDSEKGRLFEILCLYFLKHDTLQQNHFSGAWLWKFWPGNNGNPDTGIDIVAKVSDSDSFCAVQCKFRQDDSAITKSELDSFLALSSKAQFSQRILFTLTGSLSGHALDSITGQVPPVKLLTLQHLEASSINWDSFSFSSPENVSYSVKSLLPHQITAVDDVMKGFTQHDRGRLIMACGTGKTFTSLKIAERLSGTGGIVLVLVPSISLLNQTLLAWSYDHDENIPLRAFAVCSDSTVGRYSTDDDTYDDMPLSELAIPPTTEADDLIQKYTPDAETMTVIFSTYQSLQVVSDAQKSGFPDFHITICDEAHRTAGITLSGQSDSLFRKIHDSSFIRSHKRLYMTATPKVYGDDDSAKARIKQQAQDRSAILYDMDDTAIFGPVFHWLTFSQAVEQNLLADYKVIVFMTMKKDPHDSDLPSMIQGVRKALAKDISPEDYDFIETDKSPMHRAVAFSNTIQQSKDFTKMFKHSTDSDSALNYDIDHIDGKTPAAKRSASLLWLKASSNPDECRILSNARCLSEGVDVPALDAIIFLNPKSSQIDIAQSVGRVMRKAPGKKFGYVILPVVIQPEESPEQALDHNDSYKTVWKVLQALRAHDDHFKAEINSIDFGDHSTRIRVTHTVEDSSENYSDFSSTILTEYRQEIYIRMVRKCGDREYWDKWAGDLVTAFHAISARIASAVKIPETKSAFTSFVEELRAAVNPSVSEQDAVEMLAQHITSKEVFDALFAGFSGNNPVSRSMQKFRAVLEASGADLDPKGLENFNEHVRTAADAAKSGAAKQKLLREIYENFFRQAFSDTAKSLGIVYTPEEIVDFIIRSADWAVKTLLQIPEGLSANDVHILDPFSGTGTFTARLIESGIIPHEKLYTKYKYETHANEILLLAYYISAVNIEAAYNQAAGGFYEEFPGIILADTFRLNEGGSRYQFRLFYDLGKLAGRQEKTDVQVIIGNPPYSVGGKSADYEVVDGRITDTYARNSTATLKRSLYDSYIRAFRWASDRLKGRGIVCYVSNGSFIDSNSTDGMRKSLEGEFTSIYIFNLRGNQRGGDWRKEGQKVFDDCQCPIAITLLMKDEHRFTQPCDIRYYEVGDGLTRDEKLAELVGCESFGKMIEAGKMRRIKYNLWGDWLNQRSNDYDSFMRLGNKKEQNSGAIFASRYATGVKTGQDTWCYNFSREALCENIRTLNPEALTEESVRVGLYRPYVKMNLHFSRETNQRVSQMPAIFPKPDSKNMVICVSGVGATKDFSVLMTDCLPDTQIAMNVQCFPLFWYVDVQNSLFGPHIERTDGISDGTLIQYRMHFQDATITKEDIFCCIYGVLSSREYAARFGKDTKRLLARVPLVEELERFRAFRDAGRELGRLHVGYESAEEWPLRLEGNAEDLRLTKMRIVERGGEKVIRYNDGLTIGGIPSEAWEYVVNGRSAVEWIVERYSDSVDGKSGLRNDGNAWGRERGNERYVLELIGRVVSVSVRTVKILEGLPELGV